VDTRAGSLVSADDAVSVTAGVLLNTLLLSTPSWMAPPGSFDRRRGKGQV
jgi:hypothetical protein